MQLGQCGIFMCSSQTTDCDRQKRSPFEIRFTVNDDDGDDDINNTTEEVERGSGAAEAAAADGLRISSAVTDPTASSSSAAISLEDDADGFSPLIFDDEPELVFNFSDSFHGSADAVSEKTLLDDLLCSLAEDDM